MRAWILGLAFVALAAMLVACHRGPAGRPKVVATVFAAYDLTRRVAGPDADVVLLPPAGVRPDGYTPGPDVASRVTGARLAVLVGLDLDRWVMPLLSPSARVLRLADRVPTLTRAGVIDPHVWLDPQRALLMTRAITDDLCRVDPAHAVPYRARALEVTRALEALDTELDKRTAGWKARSFAAEHDDFRYYADRYQLEATSDGPRLAPLDAVGGTAGLDSYEALLRHDTDVLEKTLLGSTAAPPGNGAAD